MRIIRFLENDKFAKFASGAAGAVYVTTAIKAIGRPAFIYADKHSDAETKKYTAGKEFLYQLLCLGITVAMIPFFRKGGFALAKKHLKNIPELSNINKLKEFNNALKAKTYEGEAKKAMTLAKGGAELGSFVGSILGLTIIAPLISHKILHPIMHALGMEKKHEKNNIGQPTEIFLADRNAPAEKAAKVNLKA